MVLIALCAVLSGGETCVDMALFGRLKQDFLKEFLALEHGIPSHDTFSRLFRLLDPAAFRTWFIAFMQRFAETCEGVVALDGKTLRRSFDRASAASPLHLVSAWARLSGFPCKGRFSSRQGNVVGWPGQHNCCGSVWCLYAIKTSDCYYRACNFISQLSIEIDVNCSNTAPLEVIAFTLSVVWVDYEAHKNA